MFFLLAEPTNRCFWRPPLMRAMLVVEGDEAVGNVANDATNVLEAFGATATSRREDAAGSAAGEGTRPGKEVGDSTAVRV